MGMWVKSTCQFSPGWCPRRWYMGLAYQEGPLWVGLNILFQEHTSTCKTAGVDLHLVCHSKGNGFGFKGINIFRRQPEEIY